MLYLYLLLNAGALVLWLSFVNVFFKNRRQLNPALQVTESRQTGMLAFTTILLFAVAIVPLFPSWANPWHKLAVIAVIVVAVPAFVLVRSHGESAANSASRKVMRDLAKTSS